MSDSHSTLGLQELFLDAPEGDTPSTNQSKLIPTIGPVASAGPGPAYMPSITFVPDYFDYPDTDDDKSISEDSPASWTDTNDDSSENNDFRPELLREGGDYVLQVIE